MTYEITQEGLNALSPAARRLADAAIALGKWVIMPSDCQDGQNKPKNGMSA
jgi:hypothetical protein